MSRRVGPYRVLSTLGEGSMGVVYAAHDDRLDRGVALKLIRPNASDPASRERFWREAQVAARVSHPGICQIFDVGEHGTPTTRRKATSGCGARTTPSTGPSA